MQNTNTKSAASYILNQFHPGRTAPPTAQTNTFPGQKDQAESRQTEHFKETNTQHQKEPGNVCSQESAKYQGAQNEYGHHPSSVPGNSPVPGQKYQIQGSAPQQTPAIPGQNSQPLQSQTQDKPRRESQNQGQIQALTELHHACPTQGAPNSKCCDSPRRASPDDDFTEVYHTGNFGTHFGRLNVERGKKWTMVHGALSCAMFVFTLAATIMMSSYTKEVIRSILFAFSWMAAINDCFTTIAAWFLIWRLSKLKNPLTTLVLLRFSAAFNIVFNAFFFLVGLLGVTVQEKNFLTITSG